MAAVEQNKKGQKAAGYDHSNTLALSHEGAPTNDTNAEGGAEGTLNPNSEVALYQPQGNTGGFGSNAGMSNAGDTNTKVSS